MNLTPEQIWVITTAIASIGSYVVYKALSLSKKKLVRDILKDNGLLKDETRISVNLKSITIKNYKKVDNENIKKLPRILEQETGKRYLITRRKQQIKLKRMKSIPRKEGVFIQNIETGIIKKFSLRELSSWNGAFIVGSSGTGKSEIVRALIENKNTLVYSPKGSEDFKNGQYFTEQMVRDLTAFIDNYKNIKAETVIVIDEIITFISLVRQIDKKLLEKMSINFTLNRSSNLKWVIISQRLNKTSDLDLSLLNYKILNTPDIALFKDSLGVKPQTNMANLKQGQFVLMREGEEFLIQNNISKQRLIELGDK